MSSITGPVLDVGCGTGAWAFSMAKEVFPYQVFATDLTPPEVACPTNLTLLKSNAEETWTFDTRFGFIHGRMLTSGIHNWPRLLEQCFENLEPGGWLELLDICHPFGMESPTGKINTSSSVSDFVRYGQVAERCWALNGLDYRATGKHVIRMQELGFLDIQETEIRWPLGTWPEDEARKHIGNLVLSNFTNFLKLAGASILQRDPTITECEARHLVEAALKDLTENCLTRKFYLTM